jgi:hypothetical protein
MEPTASKLLPSGEDESGLWIRRTILDGERARTSGVCFRDFPSEIRHFINDEVLRQCGVTLEDLRLGREIAYHAPREDRSWENIDAIRLGPEPMFVEQCKLRAWLLKEKVIADILGFLNRVGNLY